MGVSESGEAVERGPLIEDTEESLRVPRSETSCSWISVDCTAKPWSVDARNPGVGDATSRMKFPPLKSAKWMDVQASLHNVGRGGGVLRDGRGNAEEVSGEMRDGDSVQTNAGRGWRLIRRSRSPSPMPVSLAGRLASCHGSGEMDEPRERC